MSTAKRRNRKGLCWTSLLFICGLSCSGAAAQELTDDNPICPGRPLYVQPTEADVQETGLSLEVLCVIADTYLFRHDLPGPGESPDILRRYLRQGPYENLSDAEYRTVMEEAVRLWPQSRYAHAGLAQVLLAGHGAQASPADKRRAADEWLTAAEIAFSEGRVRYVSELAQILTDLGDKAALDRYFQRVFELLPPGDTGPWYVSYLQYAQTLAKLSDERAETYFQKAIAVRPEGVWGAYEGYAQYLLANQKAQKVLELLAPDSPAQRAVPGDYFHYTRCRAFEQMGRKVEAATECQQARELIPPAKRLPSPGGQPGSGPSAQGPRIPVGLGLLARLLGVSLAQAAHNNPADDCRTNSGCAYYPGDPWGICYYYITWNLAELIVNEAGGETYGSKAAAGWTVRDRVNRVSTSACGTFGGATGACTSQCPDPQFCDLQKKYCCVIHAPDQFNDSHTSMITLDDIHLAYDVIDSHTPEPTSNFVPSGASGCTTGVCSSSLFCNQYGNDYEYAPEGPIFFYGNSATSFACRGFQAGIASSCNVVAKETCGNSTDGVGSDNCYGRATRNRTWFAGPQFTGSAGVTTSGNTKRLPSGAFMYRNDTFKNPGGKQFRVEARLEAAGQANLRVQLKNGSGGIVYDFGTITVTSTAFSNKVFTSTSVVTSTASQVVITNQGPGVVIGQTVIGRD